MSMVAVKPFVVTDATLTSSNIPLEAAVWDSGTTYDTDDQAVFGLGLYTSKVDGNTNNPPVVGGVFDSANWTDEGTANRYRMFDQSPSEASQRAGNIDVTVAAGELINSVAAINVSGTSVTVQLIDDTDGLVYNSTKDLQDYTEITDWYSYRFLPIEMKTDVVFLDLPNYVNARVRVIIDSGGGTAKCGELLLGRQQIIGDTNYGAEVGIRDFSVKSEDTFGNSVIVERAFRKLANFDVTVDTAAVASIQRRLTKLRAIPALYVGNEDREELIVFGFYKRFRQVISGPLFSQCVIEAESLTYDADDTLFSGASIVPPTITVPVHAETMPENGIFRTSAFATSPEDGNTHDSTDWQFASDAAFTSIVYQSLSDSSNLESITVPAMTFTVGNDYYVRALHRGTTYGESPYATAVKFTVGASVTITTPSIAAPTSGSSFAAGQSFTSSAFATSPASSDDHYSSDWQIASDSGFSTVVIESLADTTNLTSYPVPLTGLTIGNTYYVRVRHNGRKAGASSYSAGVDFVAAVPAGQQEWTTPGTSTFIVPAGVTSICGLVVGGGAGGYYFTGSDQDEGGGGGATRYRNAISVTPGESLTVTRGAGGITSPTSARNGGESTIKRGTTVLLRAGGATGRTPGTGTTIGGNVGGGDGATGGLGTGATRAGGGGAGGYSGAGGSGSSIGSSASGAGTGGAPSGGHHGYGGGGVGLQGEGVSGAASTTVGKGGSDGSDASGSIAGNYGGGGASTGGVADSGANGAVRIIWGNGRSFPSTNTADV